MSATAATAMNNLTFQESDHTYWVDGKRVPGVNEVMESTGVQDFSRNQGDADEYLRRGECVHHAVALLLEDNLNWDTVHEDILPYVRAAERFIQDTGYKAIDVETPLYHPGWRFAGTPDTVGTIAGREILPDWKTGPIAEYVKWQTAAYKELYLVNGIANPVERYGIQLKDNGKYKMVGPWTDFNDSAEFFGFLNTYNNQKVRIKRGECVWDAKD